MLKRYASIATLALGARRLLSSDLRSVSEAPTAVPTSGKNHFHALATNTAQTVLVESMQARTLPGKRSVHPQNVVICVDETSKRCALAEALLQGYVEAGNSSQLNGSTSPPLQVVIFNPTTFLQDMKSVGDKMDPKFPKCCVLIQSSAFQNDLKTYRLRLRLQELGFRVAEHYHLSSMCQERGETEAREGLLSADMEREMETYLRASAFSTSEAHRQATRFQNLIDQHCSPQLENPCELQILSSGGHCLRYVGGMEPCLLNTGHYDSSTGRVAAASCGEEGATSRSASSNNTTAAKPSSSIGFGNTYPIGEVITESFTLDGVSGAATCFAFPTTQRVLATVDQSSSAPFKLTVDRGVITDVESHAPASFLELLALVRKAEGEAIIRELGLGINPFVGRGATLHDVTAFERQLGVHVSMGKRHPLFVKVKPDLYPPGPKRFGLRGMQPHIRRKDGMYHFDLFLCAEKLRVVKKDPGSELAHGEEEIGSYDYQSRSFLVQGVPISDDD
jgi:hypothetical protein